MEVGGISSDLVCVFPLEMRTLGGNESDCLIWVPLDLERTGALNGALAVGLGDSNCQKEVGC